MDVDDGCDLDYDMNVAPQSRPASSKKSMSVASTNYSIDLITAELHSRNNSTLVKRNTNYKTIDVNAPLQSIKEIVSED